MIKENIDYHPIARPPPITIAGSPPRVKRKFASILVVL